ncbi:MAG: molybdate ABC transporter substrate-binding protein [Gemmataceae bacterium]
MMPLPRLTRRAWLAASAVTLAGCGKSTPVPPGPLLLAATSLKLALAALLQELPLHGAQTQFGASWRFLEQLQQGRSGDLFLSADPAAATTIDATAPVFATGNVVLWVRDDTPAIDVRALGTLPGRIAMSNPKASPYGERSHSFLARTNQWEVLKPKLVYAESAEQVAAYARQGAVAAAFLPKALARQPELQATGRLFELPSDLCPAVQYAAAVLPKSHHWESLQIWRDGLRKPVAQTLLAQHGFGPPP